MTLENTYKDWIVKGIDVSQWNDLAETAKKPDFTKARAAGMVFAAARIGYGIVKDRMFDHNWKAIPDAGMDRLGYWYLDYYSHKGKGMTGTEWGIEQAKWCWDFIHADPGPVFLDCESSSYGGKINFLNAPAFTTIARAFLTELIKLSGDKKRIYCSPGFLPFFGDWFKDAELWIAWYNEWKKHKDILTILKDNKWKGKAVIWQYASHGDVDGDGVGDGKKLGMEIADLDLNVFLGDITEYSEWIGNAAVVVKPPVVEDVVVVDPPAASKTREIGLMSVDAASGLNIRRVPVKGNNVVGWIPDKRVVEILETRQNGQDLWARVGQDQWCALKYQGKTYLK